MIDIAIEEAEAGPGCHLIKLAGEVDLHNAPELKERIDRAIGRGTRCLLVQFADGTVIDSTILGVLLGGLRRLRANDGSLRVVCRDERITRIFSVTGLDRTFAIHERVTDALSATSEGTDPQPVTSE
jgi:anti-sigma B factor antagonist